MDGVSRKFVVMLKSCTTTYIHTLPKWISSCLLQCFHHNLCILIWHSLTHSLVTDLRIMISHQTACNHSQPSCLYTQGSRPQWSGALGRCTSSGALPSASSVRWRPAQRWWGPSAGSGANTLSTTAHPGEASVWRWGIEVRVDHGKEKVVRQGGLEIQLGSRKK